MLDGMRNCIPKLRRRLAAARPCHEDPGQNHVDPNLIVAALRQDDIGVALRRLHKLEVHRADRTEILPDYLIH